MGRIFALAGCSGVGKTTLVNALVRKHANLNVIARTTSRPMRPAERDGVDYHYVTREDFLHRVFANDYVHIESNNSHFYGIDSRLIDEARRAPHDSIIIAGAGAYNVKRKYGKDVTLIFLHSENRKSLLSSTAVELTASSNREILRRLKAKASDGLFTNEVRRDETIDDFLQRRMYGNLLDLAFVNGQLRVENEIEVIENPADDLGSAIAVFESLWKPSKSQRRLAKGRSCFVLMPFKDSLRPVFENHIRRALKEAHFEVFRADGIFSVNPIMEDVLDSVYSADVIIADLTGANPNVFYETGICHALGKKVILITQDEEVPTDLKHRRWLKYRYTPEGMIAFEAILKETVAAVCAPRVKR